MNEPPVFSTSLSVAGQTPGEVVITKSCVCPLRELTGLLPHHYVHFAVLLSAAQCQAWCWGLGHSGKQSVRDLFLGSVHLNSSSEIEKRIQGSQIAVLSTPLQPPCAPPERQCGAVVKDRDWWP